MIFLPQDIMYLSNIDFSNLIGVQMYELLKACLIYKSRLFSLSLRYDSINIITHNLKKQETRSTSVQSLNECCFTHFEQWISGWSYDPNCVNFHFLFLPLSFFCVSTSWSFYKFSLVWLCFMFRRDIFET